MDEKFKNYLDLINDALESTAATWHDGRQDVIYEAMKYYFLAPGKRIRPVLTLAFCEDFGVSIGAGLPFACALEMIHAYSLIHDDLPCMDDDDLRRGRPTCHKVYGEAIAVLAGDALLNRAFETMLASDAENAKKAALSVGKLAGASGMIGGQVIDINGSNDKDTILKMYELKTGALLTAPAEIAIALSGSKDEVKNKAATAYTNALGLAFQIKDDLLDVFGDTKILGKTVGSDADSDKNTLYYCIGKEKCEALLEEYTNIAIESAKKLGKNSDFFVKLAEKMLNREN